MNDFLFTARGKNYLVHHYVEQGKSTHVIARERGIYPNLVRRALTHHGIPIRDRSQAQRQALQSGRHRHPTRGRSHSEETRQKIGEAVSRSWLVLDARRRRQGGTGSGEGKEPGKQPITDQDA